MKVLILSCNTGEGHNSAAKALKSHLLSIGIDCTITDTFSLVGNHASQRLSDFYIYSTRTNLFKHMYRIGEAVSDMLDTVKSPVYLWNKSYSHKLQKYISSNGFDAVICVHLFPAQAMTALRLSGKSSIPTVFVMTDYSWIPFLDETVMDYYVIPHEHRIGDRVFARYMIRSLDGYVAMSESVLKDARSFDETLPYGLTPHPLYDNFGAKVSREEAIRELELDADTRYILFFGLIRDYKGLDLLLRAFADKRLRGKRVKLIVAGEFYSNAEMYERLENELELAEHIVWHKEFVPADKVRYFFAAADLVAQPYKTATQSGITQIAYHFERPMLVTNVGGLAEIVPHGKVGYVVEPDAKDIAEALVDFMDNHTEADFSEGILEEKAKYAWSNMTQALYDVADNSKH